MAAFIFLLQSYGPLVFFFLILCNFHYCTFRNSVTICIFLLECELGIDNVSRARMIAPPLSVS